MLEVGARFNGSQHGERPTELVGACRDGATTAAVTEDRRKHDCRKVVGAAPVHDRESDYIGLDDPNSIGGGHLEPSQRCLEGFSEGDYLVSCHGGRAYAAAGRQKIDFPCHGSESGDHAGPRRAVTTIAGPGQREPACWIVGTVHWMGAVEDLVDQLRERSRETRQPIIASLDGRSGAGKSTLASSVAATVGATLIEGDDFYSGGRGLEWDLMSPAERSLFCIDWRRQRTVLRCLRDDRSATWFRFDWDAFDGRLAEEPRSATPAGIVILEGVYSARPELQHYIDFTVLLDTPDDLRRRRLLQREGDADPAWSERWHSAEDYYFERTMPASAFDLVLGTAP